MIRKRKVYKAVTKPNDPAHRNPDSFYPKICGAKLRNKDAYCQRPPVNGRTRCRIHGGTALKGEASPRFKNGDTSKYVNKKALLEKIEEYKKNDNVRDLRNELSILRGLLAAYMEHHENLLDDNRIELITRLIDKIEKVVSSLKVIEEGHTITIKNVQNVLVQVVRIIKARVRDTESRTLIARDFKNLSYTSIN